MDRQTILMIVLVIVLGVGGWFWYTQINESGVSVTENENENETASQQFLAKVEVLDKIKIDTDFFKNDIFTNLESSQPIPQIPSEINGRTNPFAQF